MTDEVFDLKPTSSIRMVLTSAENPVTLTDLEAALDALIMQEAPPLLEPSDITIEIVKTRANCGGEKAKAMIKKWVAEGKVEYVGMRREERGHQVKAWRLKP